MKIAIVVAVLSVLGGLSGALAWGSIRAFMDIACLEHVLSSMLSLSETGADGAEQVQCAGGYCVAPCWSGKR
jgi:hypothetical protein